MRKVLSILTTLSLMFIFFNCDKKKPTESNEEEATVKDFDGNAYHTVTIGKQEWMVENLKATHYRNGDPIPNVTGDTDWFNQTTGAYCNYDDNEENAVVYGRLYNWHAVNDSRNIAPAGWHVPSDDEWATLVDFLGGDLVAGGKIKEKGTTHWISPNAGATDESGFSALPAGAHDFGGSGGVAGYYTGFWSSTEATGEAAWRRNIGYNESRIYRLSDFKIMGFSVRCVKDK